MTTRDNGFAHIGKVDIGSSRFVAEDAVVFRVAFSENGGLLEDEQLGMAFGVAYCRNVCSPVLIPIKGKITLAIIALYVDAFGNQLVFRDLPTCLVIETNVDVGIVARRSQRIVVVGRGADGPDAIS